MDAQTITNLLTFCLAVATVWLGAETRRMAVAAKASIDLESTPYLALRGFYVNIGALQDPSTHDKGALRVGLRLTNPGKVLVTYQVESMSVRLGGSIAANPRFDTTAGVVHPADEMIFFYPLIPTASPVTPPLDIEVEYTISYWAVAAERRKVRAKVKLSLISASGHEWNYIDGPHYS